jgi:hypothetical protein
MSWQHGNGSMIRLRKASNRNYGIQKWRATRGHDGNQEVDEAAAVVHLAQGDRRLRRVRASMGAPARADATGSER